MEAMRRQTYIQLHRTRTFRFVVAVCISIATYYMGLLTCVILLVLLSFYYFKFYLRRKHRVQEVCCCSPRKKTQL